MKTLHLLITFAVVALAQDATFRDSAPIGNNTTQVGPAFAGDSIESLVKDITTNAAPKSEFETTAAYEARRNAARRDGAAFVFVLDSGKDLFTYDADSGTMMTSLPISKETFYLEPNHPEHTVLTLRRIERSSREYIGSNAYGAKANVSSHLFDEYGVVVNQSLLSTLMSPPMDASNAKDTKPYLRAAVACTLLAGPVMRNVSGHEATISNPFEFYVQQQYLPVTVTEILLFDERTGNVLLRVHPDNTTDLTMQRELMSKAFPIELEVRGSGMVYISIDGGSEEPIFQNKVVRAKRQMTLKLKSEYDQLAFRLNGLPYKPVWSVHNKSYGTFAMFDYAEAVISSANAYVKRDSQSAASPESQYGPHKIGETFQEWLGLIHIDIAALCRENKSACKRLSDIQKKGHGEFWTTDNSGRTFGWTFKNGDVIEIKPQ
jgi:hypothetical protein